MVSPIGCLPEADVSLPLPRSLRVLLLADAERDTRPALDALRASGMDLAFHRIDSLEALRQALTTQTWEFVLAYYPLACDCQRAVQLLRDSGQHMPCVIISTVRGESLAVTMIKAGADDYLLLDDLDRLGASVMRERRALDTRQADRRVTEEVDDRERRLKDFATSGSDWFWEMGPDLRFTYFSSHFGDLTGLTREAIVGKTRLELAQADPNVEPWKSHLADLAARRPFRDFQYPIRREDGQVIHIRVSGLPILGLDGAFLGYRGVATNVTEHVLAEARITQVRARLEDAIESITDGFALYDAQDRLVICNQSYHDGLAEAAELLRPGVPFADVVRAQARSGHLLDAVGREDAWVSEELARHRAFVGPVEYRCRDNRWVQAQEYRTREGGSLIVRTDVTERRQSDDNLRKLSRAVEQSPVSVIITDLRGVIEYVNPKFEEVTGYTAAEIIGQDVRILKSRWQHPAVYQKLWRTLRTGESWQGEFLNRRKNGDEYWEHISVSPIKNAEGVITHFLAVNEDITLRKEYEARLVHQANFDALTQLPNRNLALDRLVNALARARRRDRKVGLLLIDLDDFKKANDTLGHATGDLVLRQAGTRFSQCVRDEDTVARLGGDEYAIVLADLRNAIDAEQVAQKILEALSQPFLIGAHEVFVSASIGITIFPDNGESAETLMRDADAALYWVKEHERNGFRFFTPELNERALAIMRIESQLRHALEREELTLSYQPMVDIRSGGLIGAEALLRWRNAELGQVPPDRFIGLAEDTGLIIPIGVWALQTACHQASLWRALTARPLRMAVNVSSRQFRDMALVRAVAEALTRNQLVPHCLELEITESLLIDEQAETKSALRQLESLGVSLSVDDFGTGYSALSYLRRFRVDTVKIDKSFIRDVTADPDDAALVKAVIAMGRGLNLTVVAEGVETADELGLLWVYGCDLVQGHYFSPALTAEEFSDLLRHWEGAPKPRGRWS